VSRGAGRRRGPAPAGRAPPLTEVLVRRARRCEAAAVDPLTVGDVAKMKMAQLLRGAPEARAVLQRHGVDPLQRCHSAALNHMTLKQVLGRTCPVDDVEATLADLLELLGG